MTDFANIVWLTLSMLLSVAYLVVLFLIVVDLFRDPDLSGKKKAVWLVCLLFFPFVTAVVYFIRRGPGLTERQRAARTRMRARADAYVRGVTAVPSSADEIAKAKTLLDAGAISNDEYVAIKRRAIEGSSHAAQ